jgi:two-component system response regulator HydG
LPSALRNLASEEYPTLESTAGHGILSLAEMEKRAITQAIEQLHGDKLEAARRLGIGKTTLYRKLKEYGAIS